MPGITTHVLDTARGKPASGIVVRLEYRESQTSAWRPIATSETNADGRASNLTHHGAPVESGEYRLTFETRDYFARQSVTSLFPRVTVVFEAAGGDGHYHVPLLLSPFGYTTYRGS